MKTTNYVRDLSRVAVVIAVVDSHIQRSCLAIKKTTMTHNESAIDLSGFHRSWSQGGREVNWSHHVHNPLLSC